MGRRLIVNADDFGFSSHTVDWTIRGFERGRLTSATIMAGFPATVRAVDYAKAHPQFSFGVHLYLTDESPMSRVEDIPSMIDPATGRLWLTRQFIVRALTGRIRKEELKREMHAQFSALRDAGLKFSHVDGHGHMHRLPVCISALIDLRDTFGIKTVRRTQNIFPFKVGLAARIVNRLAQKRLCRNFALADNFLMTACRTDDDKWFERALAVLPDGVTEIGIHPGEDEEWRRIDTRNVYDCTLPSDVQLVTYNDI